MFANLLLESSRPALLASDPAIQPLTHSSVRTFVKKFDLTRYGIKPTDRIALVLPDGSSYALCLLAIMNRYCAVPFNHKASPSEIASDIKRLRVTAIITDDAVASSLTGCQATLIHLKTEMNTPAGLFSLHGSDPPTSQGEISEHDIVPHQNALDDTILVLQTSGTSGQRKIVPYTLATILHGTNCVKDSWGIKESDLNINMVRFCACVYLLTL